MYISEDHIGAFMVDYRCVEDVVAVKNQAGIATSDIEVMVTMTYK